VISIMAKLHKRTVRALTLVTGILGVLTLLWLIFDYVLYDRLQPLVLQFKDLGELEKLSSFIWLSFLFMFFFHLLAAGTLLIQMRYLVKIQALSILAIAVGVISFLGVFSDWAVLGDIGKEYKMGWDTAGEWRILYILLGIHFIFLLLVTGLSAGMLLWLKLSPDDPKMPANDEVVFVVSQYVGRNVKISVYHSVATMILILIPYGLIVTYWLILRLRDRIGEWYDETQWRDITRAGFNTLLLLIPALLLLFIAFSFRGEHYPTNFLWFPFTLFVILFLFSLFTLLNYRRS
jgi:hypothetical protein